MNVSLCFGVLTPIFWIAIYVHGSQAKAILASNKTADYSTENKEGLDIRLNAILNRLPADIRDRLLAYSVEFDKNPKPNVPMHFSKTEGKIFVNVALMEAMLFDNPDIKPWVINSLFTHEMRHAGVRNFPAWLGPVEEIFVSLGDVFSAIAFMVTGNRATVVQAAAEISTEVPAQGKEAAAAVNVTQRAAR